MLLLASSGCMGGGSKESEVKEEIHSFAVWEAAGEEAIVVGQDVKVTKWDQKGEEGRRCRYRLEDGTDLLEIRADVLPSGGEVTEELPGLAGLDSQTAEAVTAYYRDQGLLFDPAEMLEKAYDDYRNCQDHHEKFQMHEVVQTVTQTMMNQKITVFLTALTVPQDEHFIGVKTISYDSVIFECGTGEIMDVWDIFIPDKDTAVHELAQRCNTEDNTVNVYDMITVMEQAQFLLNQNYLELWFPYGTWERQMFDKGFGFEYADLEGLLQPWILPDDR
mgnify:FL=1